MMRRLTEGEAAAVTFPTSLDSVLVISAYCWYASHRAARQFDAWQQCERRPCAFQCCLAALNAAVTDGDVNACHCAESVLRSRG